MDQKLSHRVESPLHKAVGSHQAVLHREQRGPQRRGGGHTGSLGPEAALSANPPPASSRQGRAVGLRAQSTCLQQLGTVQHAAAAAPLVCFEEAAQALFCLLSLFLRGLLSITARDGSTRVRVSNLKRVLKMVNWPL